MLLCAAGAGAGCCCGAGREATGGGCVAAGGAGCIATGGGGWTAGGGGGCIAGGGNAAAAGVLIAAAVAAASGAITALAPPPGCAFATTLGAAFAAVLAAGIGAGAAGAGLFATATGGSDTGTTPTTRGCKWFARSLWLVRGAASGAAVAPLPPAAAVGMASVLPGEASCCEPLWVAFIRPGPNTTPTATIAATDASKENRHSVDDSPLPSPRKLIGGSGTSVGVSES